MSAKQIKENLAFYLLALPGLKGINNHMGSKVCVNEKALAALMQELKKRKMFMIDSRTNSHSLVPEVARKYKVPCLSSDLFLDGDKDPQAIEKKLRQLIDIANKHGYAIGIGHIHRKNMLKVLRQVMESCGQKVDFVGIEELLAAQKLWGKTKGIPIKKAVEQKPSDNLNLQPKEKQGEELEDIFF